MKKSKFETTVLSDSKYDFLIAEVYFDSQFLFVLDREEGREKVCITFPAINGSLGSRIPVNTFIEELQLAITNLCR